MRYLRLLFCVLVFIFTTLGTGVSQAKPVRTQMLENAVLRSAAPQQQPQSSRQNQIKKALKKVQLGIFEDKNEVYASFSFAKILSDNQHMIQQQKKRQKICDQFPSDLLEIVSVMDTPHWTTGRPDYAAVTKGTKFIFLTDYLSHNQKTVVNEVRQVLHSLRAANPQAKILMALEFAQLQNATKLPIRFAKHPDRDIDMPVPYNTLFKVADQFNMDILALDDYILVSAFDSLSFKMGNTLVGIYDNDPHIKPFVKNPQKPTFTEIYNIYDFTARTNWGMQQRNNQWASYIKAVEPFYDIIVVYCGSGHSTLGDTLYSVPQLLQQPYILFDLASNEQLPENLQQAYEQAFQTVCDQNGFCSVKPNEQQFEIVQKSLQVPALWDGNQILCSREMNEQEISQKIKKLSPQQQKCLEEWEKKFEETGLEDPYLKESFIIFLPAATAQPKPAPKGTAKRKTSH